MRMASDRSQTTAVAVARATVAISLLAVIAGLGGPLLTTVYPEWATVAPVSAFTVLLLGLALAFSTSAQLEVARRLGLAATVVGAAAFCGWAASVAFGAPAANSV